ILEKAHAALKRPQALVVVPTRELALQVTREFGAIGKYRKSHDVAIYSGVPYGPQERALARGTQIVIGTPGRLLDHIEKGNLDLSGLFVVVLDEADRLLDMGFAPEVRRLLRRAPERRHTALFSATLVADVRDLAARLRHDALDGGSESALSSGSARAISMCSSRQTSPREGYTSKTSVT